MVGHIHILTLKDRYGEMEFIRHLRLDRLLFEAGLVAGAVVRLHGVVPGRAGDAHQREDRGWLQGGAPLEKLGL